MQGQIAADPLGEIAGWISRPRKRWPDEAYSVAENALIDTIACMIAGAPQPTIQKLYSVVSEWGDGPSTTIGYARSLSAPWAALICSSTSTQ